MSNLTIINRNGRLVSDSRDVAQMIGKNHAHLMRDVQGYIKILDPNPNLDSANFFISSTYKDANNQERPCYLLTKQGCEMVANKMTGEKGVLFTAKYVQAFNNMEEHIKNSSNTKLEELNLQIQLLKQLNKTVKLLNGNENAMVALLNHFNIQILNKVTNTVKEFVDVCVSKMLDAQVPILIVYETYRQFCLDNDFKILSKATFGKEIKKLGIESGNNGRYRYYKHIKLKTF